MARKQCLFTPGKIREDKSPFTDFTIIHLFLAPWGVYFLSGWHHSGPLSQSVLLVEIPFFF